jgi:hypothetical protein
MKANNKSEVTWTGRVGITKSLPVLVVIVGSFISFTGFFMIGNREEANILAEFKEEAKIIPPHCKNRLTINCKN